MLTITTDTFDKTVSDVLKFLEDPYAAAIVSTALIAYATLVAPKLPTSVVVIFDNPIVKFFALFGIAYMGSKNATVAIVAALAIVFTINTLHKREIQAEVQAATMAAEEKQVEVAVEAANIAAEETVKAIVNHVNRVDVPLNSGLKRFPAPEGADEGNDNILTGVDVGGAGVGQLAMGTDMPTVSTPDGPRIVGNNHENVPPAFKTPNEEVVGPDSMESQFQVSACQRGPHCGVYNDVPLLGPQMGMAPMAPTGFESNVTAGIMPFN
mgnify:CR=1 FL=1